MSLTSEAIEKLPRSTGVYILRNDMGQIIYIGKAKNIRSRLQTYISHDSRPYARHIVDQTETIDYVITRNETEALLLENQLIKAHKPRYNIDLKDDKTYVRIKVSTNSQWPGIYVTRKVMKDGAHYFGPYSSVQTTKKTLSAVGRIFPIRRCTDTVFRNRTRPCIYYQIGLCTAPCVNKISSQAYSQLVQDLISFLSGKNKQLERDLLLRMKEQSDRQDYETAARIRDQILAIRNTLVPQVIIGNAQADTDIFGTYTRYNTTQIAVLHIENGVMTGSDNFLVKDLVNEETMTSCILQYYLLNPLIPARIYTDILPDDKEMLEQILSDMRAGKITIKKPSRGRPRQWTGMAQENARTYHTAADSSVLDDIARHLHLSTIPYRMECYDISNLQGTSAAASRAVFIGGEPDKSLYRHYRIRGITGQDDFAMMEQVLKRRFETDETRPDLIVIDGGKGQLGICLNVLHDLGMDTIATVAIAKARGEKPDRFFLPGRKDPVKLPQRSTALKVLQQIRDEAHRFAIRYHKHLRTKSALSGLKEIPGIGEKKARAVIIHTSHLKDASMITKDDLAGCTGLSARDIANIIEYFKRR